MLAFIQLFSYHLNYFFTILWLQKTYICNICIGIGRKIMRVAVNIIILIFKEQVNLAGVKYWRSKHCTLSNCVYNFNITQYHILINWFVIPNQKCFKNIVEKSPIFVTLVPWLFGFFQHKHQAILGTVSFYENHTVMVKEQNRDIRIIVDNLS